MSMRGLGNVLTDAWNVLTGKPQSWYTNVSNIQNQLSVVLAGVTAVGADTWNFISQSSQGPSLSQTPASGVDAYETVISAINSAIAAIIVTQSKVPSDADIASAQSTASTYQSQLAYVQSVAPEIAAQVQADQAQVESMLPGPMQSPAAVGQAAFVEELDARAKALLGSLTFASIAAIAVAGLFGFWYFFGRGR